MDVSSASCGLASDNGARYCAPRMNDGRLFTDYRPRCDTALEHMPADSGSYEFRQYLIRNGQGIVASLRAAAHEVSRCGPCGVPYDVSTMVPEADRVVCDKVACRRVPVAQPAGSLGGIGTGRAYGYTRDAEAANAAFLKSRQAEQRALRDANPCGCGSGAAAQSLPPSSRWAVPGGGNPSSRMLCTQ